MGVTHSWFETAQERLLTMRTLRVGAALSDLHGNQYGTAGDHGDAEPSRG
jgi:hypothetical protein